MTTAMLPVGRLDMDAVTLDRVLLDPDMGLGPVGCGRAQRRRELCQGTLPKCVAGIDPPWDNETGLRAPCQRRRSTVQAVLEEETPATQTALGAQREDEYDARRHAGCREDRRGGP